MKDLVSIQETLSTQVGLMEQVTTGPYHLINPCSVDRAEFYEFLYMVMIRFGPHWYNSKIILINVLNTVLTKHRYGL